MSRSLLELAVGLRNGTVTSVELTEAAIRAHEAKDFGAYKIFDKVRALEYAREADKRLKTGSAPPLCGLPFSIKDLKEWPTFAGTSTELPSEAWRKDAWLVAAMLEQGAVPVGKTHTVELAFGALGTNPHWGTPRNPRDTTVHRCPGGSSSGAGVSIVEGSALIALGTDTGGSIRIPASVTGTVGLKLTKGRWSTAGVVPVSGTLDTVGALTRTVKDQLFFFTAIDEQRTALRLDDDVELTSVRIGKPQGRLWTETQPDIAKLLVGVLESLTKESHEDSKGASSTFDVVETDGSLLDEALDLYLYGGISGAECGDFLRRELPDWLDKLHPTVGDRVKSAPESLESDAYRASLEKQAAMIQRSPTLFRDADGNPIDVVALPTQLTTPPKVSDVFGDDVDLAIYAAANKRGLAPTCPGSILGLCAISIPVGTDDIGMPVGLQLVAPPNSELRLLHIASAIESLLL